MGAVCGSSQRRVEPESPPPQRAANTNKVHDTVSRSSLDFRYRTRLNLPESVTGEELLANAEAALRKYCYSSLPMDAEIPSDNRIVS